MPVVQLTCPRCVHSIRCHRLIAPGERLRCPHCSASFRAGIDEPPRDEGPSRGRGIVMAWTFFAAVLLLLFAGLTIAVVFKNRTRADESLARAAPEEAASIPGPVSPSEPAPPPVSEKPPAPPPSKPAPAGDPPPVKRDPPPPPLPAPPKPKPRPQSDKTPPAQPEKIHAPAPPRKEAPQVRWLPPRVQRQVDRAIDNGVEYLRRRQHADGTWGSQTGKAGKRFTPGIAALAGLTLLECGVPANDGQVRQTAKYLRQRMPELNTTYSISLALLFFDRLGDKEDVTRIRTLALRLVAGQKTSGGWDYYCPTLRDEDELGLLALLYKDRPTTPLNLFTAEPAPKEEATRPDEKSMGALYRPRPSKVLPLDLFVADKNATADKKDRPSTPSEGRQPPETRSTQGADAPRSEKPSTPAENDPRLPGDSRRLSKRALQAAEKLPDSLRNIPALRAAELLRDAPDLSSPRTDNSNTQFAILGLLTAENYDVPMERAMALVDWRFRASMSERGGWNYQPKWPTTPGMTAAALMGLALKHGLLLPNRRHRGRNVTVRDELIQRGFFTLNGMIEEYGAGFVFNRVHLDKLDLYCLWTVERVAVLYNLRSLGTVQWYPAGASLILPLQREDGSWSPKGTTCLGEPCVATSFALLFLKRSNLARDLTERLKTPADD
jgi:hypothetical protein